LPFLRSWRLLLAII